MNRQNKKTFGDELEHFILSIDIVEKNIKDQILGIIKSYLKDTFDIYHIVFHTEANVNGSIGLQTNDWLSVHETLADNIKDINGEYKNQVSVAYDKNKKLWIHGENRKSLYEENSYEELWSDESKNIPKYVKKTDDETLTSIIIPVKKPQSPGVMGVINFESRKILDPTKLSKLELEKIANSILTLYFLNGAFTTQIENTRLQLNYLQSRSKDINSRKLLSKPKVFVACSSKAESDVIGQIEIVLGDYHSQGILEYTHWNEMSQSGIAIHHVMEEINHCLFGICYFSEPTSEKNCNSYVDNPNVLFEAGAMSTKGEYMEFESLLPIREKHADSPPFDLSGIRLLEVPRDDSGKLNSHLFSDELKRRIDKLLIESGAI